LQESLSKFDGYLMKFLSSNPLQFVEKPMGEISPSVRHAPYCKGDSHDGSPLWRRKGHDMQPNMVYLRLVLSAQSSTHSCIQAGSSITYKVYYLKS
ncbi:hypothetical protein HAX54_025849, partial [Datura stramonium]|nr:hypothetical protein [Datura stramonium]